MAKSRKSKPVAEHIETQQPAAENAAPTEQPDPATEFDPAKLETPATPIIEQPANSTRIDQLATGTDVGHKTPDELFAGRDWNRFADPKPIHSVKFPDGYEIRMQESPSRRTVEIQFGQGRREDQPKNFAAIKEVLHDAGLRWNGTNAWAIDLVPERGSFHEREMAKRRNKEIRTEVEEQVLPALVGLEEVSRGTIELTDECRSRIGRPAGGTGRA